MVQEVTEPKPRVNFELLQRYLQKKVLLIGRVEGIDSNTNTARVTTADGGIVNVQLKQGSSIETQFVEFEGVVTSPESLNEIDHVGVGGTVGEHTVVAVSCCTCANSQQAALPAYLVADHCRKFCPPSYVLGELCSISLDTAVTG